MAKNRKPHCGQDQWLIEQAKQIAMLKDRLKADTEEIYACFCKVLNEKYGWTYEQITDLFVKTEEAWNECCEDKTLPRMIEWCEEVTGFSVVEGSKNGDE